MNWSHLQLVAISASQLITAAAAVQCDALPSPISTCGGTAVINIKKKRKEKDQMKHRIASHRGCKRLLSRVPSLSAAVMAVINQLAE